jgi:hypothetical protein
MSKKPKIESKKPQEIPAMDLIIQGRLDDAFNLFVAKLDSQEIDYDQLIWSFQTLITSIYVDGKNERKEISNKEIRFRLLAIMSVLRILKEGLATE